jgi:hypothetical protein
VHAICETKIPTRFSVSNNTSACVARFAERDACRCQRKGGRLVLTPLQQESATAARGVSIVRRKLRIFCLSVSKAVEPLKPPLPVRTLPLLSIPR